MMLLTDLALRSSVILAIGLIANAALTRQSAALRHLVLAATIVATAAVLPLSLWLPEWTVPITSRASSQNSTPAPVPASVTAVEETSVSTAASPVDTASMVAIAWMAGCVLTGVFLFVGIWRLWRTARRRN